MENNSQNNNKLDFATTKVSLTDLQKITGIRRQTISTTLDTLQLKHEVGPSNSKLYKLDEILTRLFKLNPDIDLPETTKNQDNEKHLLMKARREKAEIEVLKLQNQLVPLAIIEKAITEEYNNVRNQLSFLGDSLCRELALEADPEAINLIIKDKVNKILEVLQAESLTFLEAEPNENDQTLLNPTAPEIEPEDESNIQN